eukprot:432426-Alexandrium_andersonii.AAC.1
MVVVPMAEAPRRKASSPPLEAAPDGHRPMGESALTGQLGAPLRGAPSCYVRASSPIVRRPSGGSLEP